MAFVLSFDLLFKLTNTKAVMQNPYILMPINFDFDRSILLTPQSSRKNRFHQIIKYLGSYPESWRLKLIFQSIRKHP